MTMNEIQSMLTVLMRGIDKKTLLTVEARPDPNRPAVMVHLSRDKRTRTLEFPTGTPRLDARDLRSGLAYARLGYGDSDFGTWAQLVA